MAAAATLIPGARYPVRAGEFEGQLIEIVSNVTEPDDSPLRRRIPVRIVRNGVAEEQVYILPRLIHDGNLTPKRMAEQAARDAGHGLRVGMGVFHNKFGEGVVVTLEGQGPDARAQVHFGRHGSKWLALSVAKLTPTE